MKFRKLTTVLLIAAFFSGLSLLLYPTLSNYWNTLRMTRVVANYTAMVSELDAKTYRAILKQAHDYNHGILFRNNPLSPSEKEKKRYPKMLRIGDSQVMGCIEIPKIGLKLPILHGTEPSVLQSGVGHIEWSSLPVGGESTHCVLSGHRGLPSAKLFTDLDRLETGDIFTLQVLDETLVYEVDQILTVTPEDVEALQIVPGEDYCTLVTCTPYGVNTHRLLVRGKRTALQNDGDLRRISADAMQIEPEIVAPVLAIPLLLILLIWLLIGTRKREKNPGEKKSNRKRRR